MKVTKINAVRRAGDGTFHQAFIYSLEEMNMKLKCNLCVKEHGDAVKTDQLLVVKIGGVNYLVCVKHWERVTGKRFQETKPCKP